MSWIEGCTTTKLLFKLIVVEEAVIQAILHEYPVLYRVPAVKMVFNPSPLQPYLGMHTARTVLNWTL
eukprot:2677774-Rhodomonas_salina.2